MLACANWTGVMRLVTMVTRCIYGNKTLCCSLVLVWKNKC